MMEWQSQGSCKGKPLEWFFFKQTTTEVVFPQVADLCSKCPVRADCLTYAITTRSEGIWAGTTTADRRNPNRQRRELKARMTECGSYGGYQKHLRDKTQRCYECKVARNAYIAQQRRGGYQYGPTLSAN
jgi:WhiB family redox-sensing transcriptional regulator